MVYEFSVPMPFSEWQIKKISEINQRLSESKITSLYNCLPANCEESTGFEQGRVSVEKFTLHDYLKVAESSINNGFKVVYLLNNPLYKIGENDDVEIKLQKIDRLINEFRKVGSIAFRVTNTHLLEYFAKNYPDIELYASTSQEFYSIKQYDNLFKLFPQVKNVIPSCDANKNFLFLKNFKKKYPNVNIELMVNEGCSAGCPMRNEHCISAANNLDLEFHEKCCPRDNMSFWLDVCKSNIIFPWEIKEYSAIGINHFKMPGRNSMDFFSGECLKTYYKYLLSIEKPKELENICFNKLIFRYSNWEIKDIDFQSIKKYLPKISHFKKQGHLCSSVCGVKCKYCYKCAEKLNNMFSVI